MIKIKFIKLHFTKILSVLLFLLLFGAYAKIFAIANPYNPGQTLDPNCLPGEVNCTVLIGTGGGLSSATGTAPLTLNLNSNALTGSIAQANGSTNGYLSSSDWTTFNGKQATLVSGTNIKTINSTSILGSGDIVVPVSPVTIVNSTNLFSTGFTGTGSGAEGTTDSIFLGQYAGYQAKFNGNYSNNSNILGQYAGYQALAIHSNFLGQYAGYQAIAFDSNFFGYNADKAIGNPVRSAFDQDQPGLSRTMSSILRPFLNHDVQA